MADYDVGSHKHLRYRKMCVCVLFLAPYARSTRYEEAFFLKAKNGLIIKCVSAPLAYFSVPAAGLSSCSRLRGTQGARLDPARRFGLWPRSVAPAMGLQSRKSARGGIPST